MSKVPKRVIRSRNSECPQPENEDILLWRYVDAISLIKLIVDKKLHLSRIDQMDDALEGMLPPQIRDEFLQKYVPYCDAGLPPELNMEVFIDSLPNAIKSAVFISSWCQSDHEDALLWYRYAKSGFAIRTTYKKLCDSLSTFDEGVSLVAGCVSYVKFEEITMASQPSHQDGVNGTTLVMTKDLSYSAEKEVRVVAWRFPVAKMDDDTGDPCISFADNPVGIELDVDLSIMFGKIVASPWTPSWQLLALKSVCLAVGLEVDIEQSSLPTKAR